MQQRISRLLYLKKGCRSTPPRTGSSQKRAPKVLSNLSDSMRSRKQLLFFQEENSNNLLNTAVITKGGPF